VWLLRIFLCGVVAAEAACYGVISPLLPRLAHDLSLDNLGVGLLMGAFTAGMLPACVMLMVARRPVSDLIVVLAGVLTVASGCLVFGNVAGFEGPLLGRFLMGAGSAWCFSGATQWLVKSAPGAEVLYFGLGWGMLSVGTALGPLLGTVAASHGAATVHDALGGAFLVFVVLLALLATSPHLRRLARPRNGRDTRTAASLLGNSAFRGALVPVTVPALAIGLCFTLIPLRLAGAGEERWVGATFTAAAIIGAAAGPMAAMAVRRVGAGFVTVTALVLGAALVATMGTPVGLWVVAAATVAVLGVSNEVTTVGASELIRTVGQRIGNSDAAPVYVTLTFAVFETVGAVFAAKSQDLYASLPYVVLAVAGAAAGLCVARRRRPEVADLDGVETSG
jgi:MFS family permease